MRGYSIPRSKAPTADVQLALISGRRPVEPQQHSGREPSVLVGQAVAVLDAHPPLEAKIVCSALEQRVSNLSLRSPTCIFQRSEQGRNVFLDDLLLQVDSVGRDYDAPAVQSRVQRGREQIRQRLADSGASLDDQPLSVVDRLCHGSRHLYLFRPPLESRQRAREWPIILQQLRSRIDVDLLFFCIGLERLRVA